MASSPSSPSADSDDPSVRPLSSWYAQGVSDGFGDRLLMFDNAATGPLELLRVRPDFSFVPDFETDVRARFERLQSFAHRAFALTRSVDQLDNGEGLTVVSAHVAGTRLSDLFDSKQPATGMHPASVRGALTELVSAMAELHRQGPEIAHGAFAADRIVMTADRRLVITDYVFGEALTNLRLPSDRLWSEFGIVSLTPRGAGPLDQRGDVVQLALLVMSLVLGRRVTPTEYAQPLAPLLDEVSAVSDRRAPDVTRPLRSWLEQALAPEGFPSAAEAERALVTPFGLPEPVLAAVAVQPAVPPVIEPVVAPVVEPVIEPVIELVAPAIEPVAPVIEPVAPVIEVAIEPTRPPASSELAPPVRETPRLPQPAQHELRQQAFGPEPVASPNQLWRWVAAALALLALAQGALIGRLAARPPAAAATHLTIESPAPGDTVLLDGQQVGVTPLELPIDAASRSIRVVPQAPTVAPGSVLAVSQPPAPQPDAAARVDAARDNSGGVRVLSPITVQIVDGDKVLGSSANGAVFTTSGVHELDLSNNVLGFSTRQTVRVLAGRIVLLQVNPPNGTVSINAQPWAQVFIDGRAAGDTPIANLSVPLGEHEVVFRHPQLGERRQKAIVQAGALTRVSATFNP